MSNVAVSCFWKAPKNAFATSTGLALGAAGRTPATPLADQPAFTCGAGAGAVAVVAGAVGIVGRLVREIFMEREF